MFPSPSRAFLTCIALVACFASAGWGQEFGGLLGRFALALLVTNFASRRKLLRVFLLPGLIVVPLVFWAFSRGHDIVFFSYELNWPGFHTFSVTMLGVGIMLAGFFTVTLVCPRPSPRVA